MAESEKLEGILWARMAAKTSSPSPASWLAAPSAKPSTMVWIDMPTQAARPRVWTSQPASSPWTWPGWSCGAAMVPVERAWFIPGSPQMWMRTNRSSR